MPVSNIGTNAVRSPSYPNAALPFAVDAVGKIEAQYRTASVDRLAAVKILGYSSLSGPAAKALAALASYGLVERAGKGELRVTARAISILHSDSHDEKLENLRMAANEPNLFRELQDRFPGIIPPEDGVVTYLNRQGFNQNAIRPATRAYLETMGYLDEVGASGNDSDEELIAEHSPEISTVSEAQTPVETTSNIFASTSTAVPIAFANSATEDLINKINMNIQGDRVHLSGLFDFEGLGKLEKKIAGLKALMAPDDE